MRTVHIYQRDDGWEVVEQPAGDPVKTNTAVQALGIVTESSRLIAEQSGVDVTQINWITTSRVGTIIVNAIIGK
jgi:hypothetical protein